MPTYSEQTQNAAIKAITDLHDGQSMNIYSAGSGVPASIKVALTDQTLLASFSLPTPAYGAPSNGTAIAEGVDPATGVAAGNVAFARIGTHTQLVLGEDFTIDDAEAAIGKVMNITSMAFTQPDGA